MELASNLTTPLITPENPISYRPNLTNSPVTLNTTLTGSNKKFSPWNCHSGLLNINSSKNNILSVEAQSSASKSYVTCELSVRRNQIESFTDHTKMWLGHENRNIDTLHKNIAFLQNE